MGQIDEVTNQNTAGSQDVSSGAQKVTVLVDSMTTTIGQLVELLEGAKKHHELMKKSPSSISRKNVLPENVLPKNVLPENVKSIEPKVRAKQVAQAEKINVGDNKKYAQKRFVEGGALLPSHDDDRFQDV
jgi:hypothetical protein